MKKQLLLLTGLVMTAFTHGPQNHPVRILVLVVYPIGGTPILTQKLWWAVFLWVTMWCMAAM
jgi:hypothetical protein